MNVKVTLLVWTTNWLSLTHYVQYPHHVDLSEDNNIKYILESSFKNSCDLNTGFVEFSLLSAKQDGNRLNIVYACHIPFDTNIKNNTWYDINNPILHDYNDELATLVRGINNEF